MVLWLKLKLPYKIIICFNCAPVRTRCHICDRSAFSDVSVFGKMCSIICTCLDWRCSVENETLCCISRSSRRNETNSYQLLYPSKTAVVYAVGLPIVFVIALFVFWLIWRSALDLKHKRAKWIKDSISKGLHLTKLRDIGLAVGYDCLELTGAAFNKDELDEPDELVFTYAMDILSLALHQIENRCTSSHTQALDQYSKNVVTTLQHRLPVSKKTILETMLTAAGNVIRFPEMDLVSKHRYWLLRKCTKPSLKYVRCKSSEAEPEMVIQSLLNNLSAEHQAAVLTKTSYGGQWLFDLVKGKQWSTLRLLLNYLEYGCKINLLLQEMKSDRSVIMASVACLSVDEMSDMMKALGAIKAPGWNALLRKTDSCQQTVLHHICILGRFEMLPLLVTNTESPSLFTLTDDRNATFLDYGLKDIPYEILCGLMMDVFQPDDSNSKSDEIDFLLMNRASIEDKTTVLHELVRFDRHDIIKFLINKCTTSPVQKMNFIVLENASGQTALASATSRQCLTCNKLSRKWKKLLLKEAPQIEDIQSKLERFILICVPRTSCGMQNGSKNVYVKY